MAWADIGITPTLDREKTSEQNNYGHWMLIFDYPSLQFTNALTDAFYMPQYMFCGAEMNAYCIGKR
jgi:hypothetical protein